MSYRQHFFKTKYFISITVAVWATVMFLFFPSCGSKDKKLAAAIDEKDSLPDMHTTGVVSYVSDSGMIRYKIVTDEWLVFTKKNPPYWAFEKGLYLEKFDSLFRVNASIKADTAYYHEKKEIWELRGNVHIQNQLGDKFDTELLFWDQSKERIYSDKFIKIEQEDKILTGYGFDSNQEMTEYEIFTPTGIFTVEDTAPQDTTNAIQNTNN
ncbi:LPS export ABC transporter periplasmic protein LptC [Bacteroides sp.]|uniref:LPS export ABC transporter periplasmic protein LptC n=1 Tax=Bacteroides sp. TaxID=29523 RepID=UPI0025BAD3AB|nr:LPS export ABC transporter periplasmic protein LptC [Bacteroides sp.]